MVLVLCCRYTVYIPHPRLPRCTPTPCMESKTCLLDSNTWQRGKPTAIKHVKVPSDSQTTLTDYLPIAYHQAVHVVSKGRSRGVWTKENNR